MGAKARKVFERCLCGCGQPVKKGRMFLQGHDMKLKSLVIKVNAGEASMSDVPSIALTILRGPGVGGLKLKRGKKARKAEATE
jgi:hypothetical protein